MNQNRALGGILVISASFLVASACSKRSPDTRAEDIPTSTNASPSVGDTSGSDYETVWCRGGGSSWADTQVELLTFSARSKGTYIETVFEFDASAEAAGNDGHGLKPGTCAYADRPYGSARIRLKFGEEERGYIGWRTTAKGMGSPTFSVRADGISSDKWLMKARVTKAAAIGSYEVFKL